MQSEYLPLQDLTPSEINPRNIKKQAFERLKTSLRSENGKRFFEQRPCLVNRRDNQLIIYAGNMRYRAAVDLGWTKIPCVVDEISIEEERERTIKDNVTAWEWDFDILANNFEASELLDWGFDQKHIPFDKDPGTEGKDNKAPALPVEARAKLGQLFILGEHRLLCGDSRTKEDLRRLMNGEQGNLVFTDPLYGVDYESQAAPGDGFSGMPTRKILTDDLEAQACTDFFEAVLRNLQDFTAENVSLYWWFANKNNWLNRIAWENTGWRQSQVIIWLKDQMIFSPGKDYHRCYEACMFGWKRGQAHYKNKRLVTLTDLWMLESNEFQDYVDVWLQKRDPYNTYVHPTQKPVALAERALRKNSMKGSIVVDVFGGSGSTMIACEKLARRCFMMELDPRYCDVIINRFAEFAGKSADKVFEAAEV